ncbi:MAG: T9SS type A sorting domain-containing protein [Candidatus Eisenbacteria sp.]|nr:T9SS type A sorting domain-containing protein [Candidatus Eisenbacteria bacterium]
MTVAIRVETPDAVIGFDARLRYDSTRVQVTRIEAGPFLGRDGGNVADFSSINDSLEEFRVILAVLDDPDGVAGSDTIALITITAAAEDPTTTISFLSAILRNPDNEGIPVETDNLQVELSVQSEEKSFILAAPAGRYALVSLPLGFPAGTRLSDALQELGTPGPWTWRGFGLVDGVLTENPLISRGGGYWLATALPHDPITVIGFTPAHTVTVPLAEGWSAIGVPDPDIGFPWSAVRVVSSDTTLAFGDALVSEYIQPQFYWFVDQTPNLVNTDGDYTYSDANCGHSTDNPLGGYLAHVYQPCTLVFPSQGKSAGSGRVQGSLSDAQPERRAPPHPEWTIELTAASSHDRERRVTLGTCSGSRVGWDRSDVLNPPFFVGGLRLSIIQEGCSWKEFMQAYDAADAPRHEWTIRVSGDDDVAALSWSGIARLPEDLGIYLVDRIAGHAVDMRLTSTHDFVLAGGERTLSVLVDPYPYSGNLLSVSRTAIHSIAPNPAFGRVTIDYELGRAGAADLRVFDVTGRQVAVLDTDLKDRGNYSLIWQVDRAHLAPGIYFARLRSGTATDTRRVSLIR